MAAARRRTASPRAGRTARSRAAARRSRPRTRAAARTPGPAPATRPRTRPASATRPVGPRPMVRPRAAPMATVRGRTALGDGLPAGAVGAGPPPASRVLPSPTASHRPPRRRTARRQALRNQAPRCRICRWPRPWRPAQSRPVLRLMPRSPALWRLVSASPPGRCLAPTPSASRHPMPQAWTVRRAARRRAAPRSATPRPPTRSRTGRPRSQQRAGLRA